jgi:hypothetical protein
MTTTAHSHTHGTDHSHSHPHVLDPELAQLGPSDPGSVVLDIGGVRGSLIILTTDALAGAEIEISPIGADDSRTHIAIRERRAPGGTRWAGIFPPLLEGDYTVWNLDGTAHEVITIVAGEVTKTDWR